MSIFTHFLFVIVTHGHGSRCCNCLMHGDSRRITGRGAAYKERLERRQRAAAERSGQSGAAGVGDLGAVEREPLELRQRSRRRRRRTCRRRRRQESKEVRPSTSRSAGCVRDQVSPARSSTARPARGPPAPRRRWRGVKQPEHLSSRGRAPHPQPMTAASAEEPAQVAHVRIQK